MGRIIPRSITTLVSKTGGCVVASRLVMENIGGGVSTFFMILGFRMKNEVKRIVGIATRNTLTNFEWTQHSRTDKGMVVSISCWNSFSIASSLSPDSKSGLLLETSILPDLKKVQKKCNGFKCTYIHSGIHVEVLNFTFVRR